MWFPRVAVHPRVTPDEFTKDMPAAREGSHKLASNERRPTVFSHTARDVHRPAPFCVRQMLEERGAAIVQKSIRRTG